MAQEKQKQKQKLPSMTSPKGIFKYPKLTEPDYGSTEYPNPDGKYSVKLVYREDDPAVQAFLQKLEPLYDEAIEAAKKEFKKLKVETRKKLKAVTENPLYTVLYDQETEEPTGEIEFKFACPAGGTFKKGPKEGKTWEKVLAIFDAKGTRMKEPPEIWSGTTGKVAFIPSPYFIPGTGAAGLKLKLDAIQVIELSTGGVKSAKQYGFGEEDGYEYEAPTSEDSGGFSDESGEEGAGADEKLDF